MKKSAPASPPAPRRPARPVPAPELDAHLLDPAWWTALTAEFHALLPAADFPSAGGRNLLETLVYGLRHGSTETDLLDTGLGAADLALLTAALKKRGDFR